MLNFQRNCVVSVSLLALCCPLPAIARSAAPEAIAQPSSLSTTVSAQPKQSFSAFVNQAALVATQLIQQTGNTYSVTVLGERNGNITPIVFQDAQQTKYFPNAAVLLGFIKPPAAKPTKPSSEESIPTNFNSEEESEAIILPETEPEMNNF
jgi:hypothetical protein